MRVAIIAPSWVPIPPPAYGGSEAVIDSLARGLASAGHDVLLYATGDSGCPVPRAWTYDEAVGTEKAAPANGLRQAIEGYEAVQDYDVVHDHTLVGPVYAERYPGLPVVTTNHGPFEGELAAVYRAICHRVPIIAISAHQASTAGDLPIARVIRHGVEPSAFPVGAGEGGYALFLGRMNPDKGVEGAVRAARAAGVPLVIAAKMREPAEQAYFAQRVAPLMGGDVEFVGEVGGQDKLDLLAGATCLLNPIAWPEPFGMVMVEALACGTPVVVTPLGAAPEIVDDGITGFLAADDEVLISALGQVGALDRAACRRAVEARFSAERMVAEHIQLYQELAGSR